MAHKQLKTFHLFSGAGGGILADILLGHIPVGACEIESYPRNVLLARQRDGHLPEFPIWDDVCTLDGTPWRGTVDVLCGGFPCQDISAAGKGAGITRRAFGTYGRNMRDSLERCGLRFVFAENSPLLRTRGLGVVLEDLASMGYNARWGIIGARDVGAPHKRDRMWVLAYRCELDESDLHSSSIKKCGVVGEEGESKGWWHTDPAEVSNTEGRRGRKVPIYREAAWSREGENAQCMGNSPVYTQHWEQAFEPLMGRVADGVANRVDRLKAIGNGQVPQCAAVAFNILSEGLIY
jgi:DNA (cytosine-5)-methyltransferase 1